MQALDKFTNSTPTEFRSYLIDKYYSFRYMECVALGAGNFISGFFGAMGGDAMVN